VCVCGHDVFYWCVHGLFISTIVVLSWVNNRRQYQTNASSNLETV